MAINDFYAITLISEGTRSVLSSPSYEHFFPTPCFIYQINAKPPVVRGDYSRLFSVNNSTFSVEKGLRPSG